MRLDSPVASPGPAGTRTGSSSAAARLYALRPERFRELDDWMGRYRDLWERRLDRFAAELDRRKTARAKDKERRT